MAARRNQSFLFAGGLFAALFLCGCSPLPVTPFTPIPLSTPTPTPTPTPSGTAQPLGSACPDAGSGSLLVDRVAGFAMTMPANWRALAPGDQGWVTLYGDHYSRVEASVADRSIKDFAVPLEPQDEDVTVNMTVYLAANDSGETLAQLGNDYESVLTSVGTFSGQAPVQLNAGPSIWLTSTRPNSSVQDRVVAYVLLHGPNVYYFVFSSLDANAAKYAGTFTCMGQSMKFGST